MKRFKLFAAASIFTIALATSVWAGTWQPQDGGQWKYQNDDGSYATGWIEDNGKSYYLNVDGIMLADARTPDGYYVDASGVWDGQPAQSGSESGPGATSEANGQGQAMPAMSTITSTPSTVYPSGYYKVGQDIPAGEYVCMGVFTTEYSMPYYEIRANDDYDSYSDIIDNCIFNYNTIMVLKEGEYLWLDDCTASPIGEIPQIDYRSGNMFKVGYHIPAGTYRLSATSDAYSSYTIRPYPSDSVREGAILAKEYFETEATVTVTDGQYLSLNGCTFAQ